MVMQAACNEIKPLADAKSQQIILDLPAEPLQVEADPEKLNLVFVNLLNNAVRFSPTNGHISIGARMEDGDVMAWVQDNGAGIDPKELRKVFQEFYQVEAHMTRRYGGLGIGLTIAQGIVEAHGGHIWAESEGLGKGSCFKVTLPPIKG
jgi:signal transduction histidine kinase